MTCILYHLFLLFADSLTRQLTVCRLYFRQLVLISTTVQALRFTFPFALH
nr:MAG TPA: hypothetical protein [Inoviridae sp.]